MGDPAGKMVDLLMTEESARIILIAFTVFAICVALLFACILWLWKRQRRIQRGIREGARTKRLQ